MTDASKKVHFSLLRDFSRGLEFLKIRFFVSCKYRKALWIASGQQRSSVVVVVVVIVVVVVVVVI